MVTPMNISNCTMDVTTVTRLRSAASCVALCTATLLLPGFAGAAEWEIDPVRVELSPEQQTTVITLKNTSDKPTSIQIDVVGWAQLDGKDVYTASRELLVSPPIVTIPAKSEQVVRAALRRQADANSELSYRINLQELPPPPVPGFTGIQVALRISLPVFVQSQKGNAAPKMVWNVVRMPDNSLKVGLKNQGNAHVHITDFSLYLPGGNQAIASEPSASYVMAGQTREWLLKLASLDKIADGRLQLKGYTDAGNVDTELVLGRP
jgi:fimbrial chaperone protein